MTERKSDIPFATRLETFWTSFKQNAAAISNDQQFTVSWVRDHLDELQKGLLWEIVPSITGGSNLTITCEHQYNLRPLVDEIIRKAPDVEGWSFSSTRPPVPQSAWASVFHSKTAKSFPSCTVRCLPAELNFIDIEFCFGANESKLTLKELFALVEIILGEEFLQVWVGDIRYDKKFFGNLFGSKSQLIELANLRSHCNMLSEKILEGSTPPSFYFEQPAAKTGALINLSGHAEMRAMDRLTASTFYPQILQAALAGRFWSKRYSRHDETFCYLKIEAQKDVEERSEAQGCLDNLLRTQKLGCVWGGGAGMNSAFIDLVLADFDKSMPILKEFMSSQSATSKLHFFDVTYREVVLPIS
jgi:hypothetical protein